MEQVLEMLRLARKTTKTTTIMLQWLQGRPAMGISLGEEAIGFARMPGATLAFTAGSPSSTAET